MRVDGETFPRQSSGLTALAIALREHTALRTFRWIDPCSRMEAALQDVPPDLSLQALSACPHLQVVLIMITCTSANAIRNLLQLPTVTTLTLVVRPDQWLAVTEEIRQGRCYKKQLSLWMEQKCKLQGY
jgi:hypothetical protein